MAHPGWRGRGRRRGGLPRNAGRGRWRNGFGTRSGFRAWGQEADGSIDGVDRFTTVILVFPRQGIDRTPNENRPQPYAPVGFPRNDRPCPSASVAQSKRGSCMDCPACHKSLKSESLSGQTVDRCTACNGLWLDDSELGPIVREIEAPSVLPPAVSCSDGVACPSSPLKNPSFLVRLPVRPPSRRRRRTSRSVTDRAAAAAGSP